jgi:Mg/Co/Ni transporter MgtE
VQHVSAAKSGADTKVAPPGSSKAAAHEPASRAVPVIAPVTDSLINQRLAKVFAAMQAKDAARVLEQMNDSDVRAILGALSSKQQAAILGSFPTARAASIVQTTLRNPSSGGSR